MGLAVFAHEPEELSGHGTSEYEVLLESVIKHTLVDLTGHGQKRDAAIVINIADIAGLVQHANV